MRAARIYGIAGALILLLGIANAVLFAGLLPLWEGFDEAFHYGYVEELWQSGRLPVLGRSALPYDVAASFPLVPVSHVTKRPIPEGILYEDWFAWPAAERERRWRELEALRPDARQIDRGNYEAHQAPLAYLLLAPFDRWMARNPLSTRVLMLRLLCGISAIVLVFFGAAGLCRELALPRPFAATALFGIFATEMLYAATAHVANDWLGVGVSAFFFAALARFARMPGRRSAAILGGWIAAGLLAKSYFLPFALVAAGIAGGMVLRRRVRVRELWPAALPVLLVAGPWYARNIRLYGNLGGTPEAFEGIGMRQVLQAATRVDWPAAGGYLVRASLWTGNNWFNSYSRTTLNIAVLLLATGMAAWVWRHRAMQPAELATGWAVLLYLAGIAYEVCAMVAEHGSAVAGPAPWHVQPLLAPCMILACLGFWRWQRWGRVLAVAMAALWAWILTGTWVLKLFPMYSGGGADAVHLRDMWRWHVDGGKLSVTALAPVPWLYGGLVLALALTLGALTVVIGALADRAGSE